LLGQKRQRVMKGRREQMKGGKIQSTKNKIVDSNTERRGNKRDAKMVRKRELTNDRNKRKEKENRKRTKKYRKKEKIKEEINERRQERY
jgi:hypothetical protein